MNDKSAQFRPTFIGSTASIYKDSVLEQLHKVSIYTAIAINYVEMDDDRGLKRSVLHIASFAVNAAEMLSGLTATKETEERLREAARAAYQRKQPPAEPPPPEAKTFDEGGRT